MEEILLQEVGEEEHGKGAQQHKERLHQPDADANNTIINNIKLSFKTYCNDYLFNL